MLINKTHLMRNITNGNSLLYVELCLFTFFDRQKGVRNNNKRKGTIYSAFKYFLSVKKIGPEIIICVQSVDSGQKCLHFG